MLISMALAALVTLVLVATALTFIDCWIRGRYAFESLRQERALLDAGFVPMNAPVQHRVRHSVRFDTLTMAGRAPARFPSQRLAADRPSSRAKRPARGVA